MTPVERWLQSHFYELQIMLGVVFAIGFWLSWRGLRGPHGSKHAFFKPRMRGEVPALHTTTTEIRRTMTPAQVLGVPERPSEREVQRAFRHLIKHYHPDRARTPHQKSEFQTITLELIAAKELLLSRLKQRHR